MSNERMPDCFFDHFFHFLVNAYGRNGMGSEAIELYRRIPVGMRDDVAHLCVLHACSHSGFVEEGREIFEGIPAKTDKVVTTMVCPRRSHYSQWLLRSSRSIVCRVSVSSMKHRN